MATDVRVTVADGAYPVGTNTRTVCEMLGWSMAKLFGHVRRGELPPPEWFDREMIWPMGYPVLVHRHGLSLPGTYPGFPPGCDPEIELKRWRRVSKGRNIRYTAATKRAVAKAAKKGGRK